MSEAEKKIWGIHTQDEALFLKDGKIAIGWKEIGDLSAIPANRDDFKAKYMQVFPDAKKGSIPTSVGMLYRFCHEIQIGDYVVYPSKSDRMINVGEVTGDYTYVADAHEYVQQRDVKWLRHIPRTSFSQGALYEIGSAMTLFVVKNYADEFLSALDKGFKKTAAANDEDDTVGATADDIIESTKDFILKELSRNLKGYALEEFVADLLRTMGYRTTVSAQGGDSGIDITAYKDELPPRILVQVKSQDSDIKETTIQSLKGAMREGDYGLLVTLSNYTKNAQKYLESTPIIRGINGTELVDLILKYYDGLDDKYKKMIPLKMVYIPVPKED
ncbi:MAG: restriction endonuclease [Succiniclasticum sp.]|nr:restriction endonuclease [Succiniclasticum sp.]MEE3479080.1 restriction endonuclease [Succiniclasticum sp.]